MPDLIRNGRIVRDDPWVLLSYPASGEPVHKQAGKPVTARLTGAEPAPADVIAALPVPAGKVLVPLAVWLTRRPELEPRFSRGEIGVWLDACEEIERLTGSLRNLNAFPVIALDFPKAVDGRAYSSATLLRTRHGYRNELRAVGDVRRDYFQFMQRCGFDAIEPRHGHYSPEQLEQALGSLNDISEPYQGAASEPRPLWRRVQRSATA